MPSSAFFGIDNPQQSKSCYLNSILQALWHMRAFREKFPIHAKHTCPKRRSAECMLCALIAFWVQASEGQGEPISSLSIRTAFSHIYRDHNRFQNGQFDDAAEAMDAFLTQIHKAMVNEPPSTPAKDEPLGLVALPPCTRPCLVHSTFGIQTVEAVHCDAGHQGEPFPCIAGTLVAHGESVLASIDAQPHICLERAIYLSMARRAAECTEKGCSRQARWFSTLLNIPRCVFLGMSWSRVPGMENIIQLLRVLSSSLNIADCFDKCTQRSEDEQQHMLASIIVFHPSAMHYISYARHLDDGVWRRFDDANITTFGQSIDPVLSSIAENKYVPVLVGYAFKASSARPGRKAPPTTVEPSPTSIQQSTAANDDLQQLLAPTTSTPASSTASWMAPRANASFHPHTSSGSYSHAPLQGTTTRFSHLTVAPTSVDQRQPLHYHQPATVPTNTTLPTHPPYTTPQYPLTQTSTRNYPHSSVAHTNSHGHGQDYLYSSPATVTATTPTITPATATNYSSHNYAQQTLPPAHPEHAPRQQHMPYHIPPTLSGRHSQAPSTAATQTQYLADHKRLEAQKTSQRQRQRAQNQFQASLQRAQRAESVVDHLMQHQQPRRQSSSSSSSLSSVQPTQYQYSSGRTTPQHSLASSTTTPQQSGPNSPTYNHPQQQQQQQQQYQFPPSAHQAPLYQPPPQQHQQHQQHHHYGHLVTTPPPNFTTITFPAPPQTLPTQNRNHSHQHQRRSSDTSLHSSENFA